MGLWTHGMRLGGRQYAKRRRTVHRAGPRLESTAMTETVASGPMVTFGDTKSLGSVSLTMSWHLRSKAVRV